MDGWCFLNCICKWSEIYIFKWLDIYIDSQFMDNYTKKKENVRHIHLSSLNSFTLFPWYIAIRLYQIKALVLGVWLRIELPIVDSSFILGEILLLVPVIAQWLLNMMKGITNRSIRLGTVQVCDSWNSMVEWCFY